MLRIIALGSAFLVVAGLAACSGGAGDVPTQRGASLSSGGTSSGEDPGSGSGSGSGRDEEPKTSEPKEPACVLGATCECGGGGSTGAVVACDRGEPTCGCTGALPPDAG